MASTAFVFHPLYLKHMTGFDHPERPRRLSYLLEKMEAAEVMDNYVQVEPKPALLEWITAIHPPEHIAYLRKLCENGPGSIGMDTIVSHHSFEAAEMAVGGALQAIDGVMTGLFDNAFCAVRPPGHHAEADEAMGFCLVNNAAIAAHYLTERYDMERVMIIDWDVHHGNGTQHILYDRADVFYFSSHQWPLYPGTGDPNERGVGAGEGTTLNAILPAGSGDAEALEAYNNLLVPAIRDYKPQFILISAGFDAHKDDPLAGLNWTDDAYIELTRLIKGLAEEVCEGRLVSILEGGYDVGALSRGIMNHLAVLRGDL